MNKAQFVSPIILLAIIIISTIIISVQTMLNNELNQDVTEHGTIINVIEQITEQDIEYKNKLTKQVLELASTINSSGTLTSILLNQNVTIIGFNRELIIEYIKEYNYGNYSRIVEGEIIVPYPHSQMINEELRFNNIEFGTCLGTNDCTSAQTCVNEYDTGTYDWELILCLSNPLKVKINIISSEYGLTINYPYVLWNNTLINI